MHRLIKLIAAVLTPLLLLNGCGGGSDGDSLTQAPLGNTGISYGEITGFGSIFVNGVAFETGSARFSRSGRSANESDFQVGDVVVVKGELNPDGVTGTATSVSYNENVLGPVTGLAVGNSVEVLGQTVVTDSQGALDGFLALSDLSIGGAVEISGIRGASGVIHATRIINRAGTTESRLSGTVSDLNKTARSFSIGGLTVDYTDAAVLQFPGDHPVNGAEVRVVSGQPVTGNRLVAATVELIEPVTSGATNDKVEVEGIIDDVVASGNFSIGNQLVKVQSTTKFVNGTRLDIANGASAEVEGRLDNKGNLVAGRVLFRPFSVIKIEAPADAVDPEGRTITALGVTAHVDNLTQRTDENTPSVRQFSLGNVGVGDWIEIRGFARNNGSLVATKLERHEPAPQHEIQGPVVNPDRASGTIEILGVMLALQDTTRITDKAGNTLSVDTFFQAIQPGITVVEAKGSLAGSSLLNVTDVQLKSFEFSPVE